MKKTFFPLLLLPFLLTACMAPQTQSLRLQPATADEPRVAQVENVPFIPGAEQQGGPAAMAAMLQFSGKRVAPAELAEEVLLPGRQGNLAVELAGVARRQGRLVYPVAPQLEALLAALQEGYPVLVRQNYGLPFLPIWRFGVVVGADRDREVFLINSGEMAGQEVPFASFESRWARGGHWGVLVLDPAALPDSLDAAMVVRELALLEHAGAVAEAQVGFNRVVLARPDQKAAWIGLASTSLRLGQVDRAESTLRELVRRAPNYGPGLNNLADLLMKTGRPLEALPLAERAVAVLDIPVTRATLQAAHQATAPIESEALPPLPGEEEAKAKETAKPARKMSRSAKPSGQAGITKKSSTASAAP